MVFFEVTNVDVLYNLNATEIINKFCEFSG